MKAVLFWIVSAAVLLNSATVVLSIVKPAARVWPPPRRDSWQYLYDGWVSFTGLLGIVVLGVVDWNSFVFHGRSCSVAMRSFGGGEPARAGLDG